MHCTRLHFGCHGGAAGTDVLATLDDGLARACTDWHRIKKLSLLLRYDREIDVVRQVLAKAGRPAVPHVEFSFVDGFAGEKYLLEIEATATRD